MEDKKALAAMLAADDDMDVYERGEEDLEDIENIDPSELAVDEMMEALQSNDRAAFKEALRSFIEMTRD